MITGVCISNYRLGNVSVAPCRAPSLYTAACNRLDNIEDMTNKRATLHEWIQFFFVKRITREKIRRRTENNNTGKILRDQRK